jgi:hypothetical protein
VPLENWLYESTWTSIAKQRLRLELVSVFAVKNTLAEISSQNRKLKGARRCSLSSRQRINLRGWLTKLKNSEEWRVKSEKDAGQKIR